MGSWHRRPIFGLLILILAARGGCNGNGYAQAANSEGNGGASKAEVSDLQLKYAVFAKLYARLMNGEPAAELEDTIPHFARNLRIAAEVSRAYWTDSTPFDELAQAYILPARVMDSLGIRHEMTADVMHVPAGTMHTYGYLFAQLPTPYGLKGKRWIESRLDERLGLAPGMFGPFARKGEFASNVTSVLMQLIGNEVKLKHAAKLRPKVRVLGRIEQRVKWKTKEGGTVAASVFTHLLELQSPEGLETADANLLIYEVLMGGRHRLVTAFPVDPTLAHSLMGTKPSVAAEFKPRFNLYIDPTWIVIEQVNEGFSAP